MPSSWALTLWPGVDLFFVLSGFLITGILHDSKMEKQYFRNFYIRRALRIFPLYYGVFLVLVAIRHHFFYDRVVWLHLLYLANFVYPYIARANHTVMVLKRNPHLSLWFGALWSLCVEEQFYLLWPLLVRVLPTRRATMRFCVLAVLATLCLRCFLYVHNPGLETSTHYLYFATYARCDDLFVGAWLALWLRERKLSPTRLHRTGGGLLAGGIALTATAMWLYGGHHGFDDVNPAICTIGYTTVGIACAGVLLLALDEASALSRILRHRLLASFGLVSYGFYVFHGLIAPEFNYLHQRGWKGPLLAIAALAALYGLALASFHLYEKHFLRLKDVLAPGHKSVPSGRESFEILA